MLMIMVCVLSLGTAAWADDDKPIRFNELPAAAQTFIQTHYSGEKVALSKVESEFLNKEYSVIFVNGDKVEFDKNGNWTDVKATRTGAVPAAVIPARIQSYLSENFPNIAVVKLEQDRYGYEVKLANGRELEFNKQFQLTDLD